MESVSILRCSVLMLKGIRVLQIQMLDYNSACNLLCKRTGSGFGES